MKNIGQLFDKYGSDKNDNGHGYGKYYDIHLPAKINKLMEIGCWKGASIKAFKEYYDNNGQFYTINYVFGGEIISSKALTSIGVSPLQGFQEDVGFLRAIKDQFTVIVDDGSHHSDAQIISFKQLFVNNLESGGLYVIEDVYGHIAGKEGNYWRRGEVDLLEDTILPLMNSYSGGIVSQLISKQESDEIVSLIEFVHIYDDKIIFIYKK